MKKNEPITRRDFTLQSALAVLSGVAITITGCSDDGPAAPSTTTTAPADPNPNPGEPTPPTGNVTGTVSANHGHEAVIRGAELMEGGEIELDITGAADHPHTVSLTADQVEQIATGARVTRTSSVEMGHAHSVAFN